MKVLTLCYEYPPIGGGGGRVAAAVAEGLVERGHEVIVVTAGMNHLSRHSVINGVQVYRPRSFRRQEERSTVLEMGLYLVTSFVRALWLTWTYKPDVIHAHFIVPTGALAFAVGLLSRTPYVLTAHLGDVPGGFPEQTEKMFRLIKPFVKVIVSRAASVTAVSSFVADLVYKSFQREAAIILNGIRLAEAQPVDRGSRPLTLIMVGRMSPQKNPLMALEALAGLRQYQWHFHMVGSGPLIDEIQHYVDNHNLKEFVSIHGWVESDKVRELMSQADVMLMPSSAEGLPVAAIEALREGVAIIGAGIPGLKDVLENDVTGLTVDRNAESIRVAVEYLIQHRSHLRRLQFSAWEHSKRFDLNRVVELYEQELLTRPGL